MSVFQAHGFSAAGGWRGDDYSGGRNAIAPDAMIYMGNGSSGEAGWYYLEYEKRAASAGTVAKKLKGYIARRDKLPVLVAARNEAMASEFRSQAAAAGLSLWAASIPSIRIKDPQNITGATTVWLDSWGRPATFQLPQ